ncbi:MAG: beta-ketoacyl synthase chain length factor [Anaerolineales bacterium]
MMRVYINGIGLIAPGLEGLFATQPALLGEVDWQYYPLSNHVVEMLPLNERRRTTPLIKLALNTCKLAIDDAGVQAEYLASVFASSYGDFEIIHKLCQALCEKEKFISPTLFHNSVHNASAGYWAIAANSHAPSSSISAADASFAAGILESVTQVITNRSDLLLVSYDYPPPEPLDKKCTITMPFGLAFILSTTSSDSTRACLHIDPEGFINTQTKPTICQNLSLEQLRGTNPTAKSLPLLESICRKQSRDIVLPYIDNSNIIVHIET